MRCEELRKLFDLYLDCELPEEQARTIERHLMRCQSCGGELRSLEQTRALLRESVSQEEPSPAFRERTCAKLMASLSSHLQPAGQTEFIRQWALPFPNIE